MKWISIEDREPEEEGSYLCHFSDGTIETFDYPGTKYVWGVHQDIVTHWMPLPEPPEGE